MLLGLLLVVRQAFVDVVAVLVDTVEQVNLTVSQRAVPVAAPLYSPVLRTSCHSLSTSCNSDALEIS